MPVLQFPVNIEKFKKHYELKDKILDAINRQKQVEHLVHPPGDSDITRCDWESSRSDGNREWFNIIKDDLMDHMTTWCSSLGYDTFKCSTIWFQQYATKSKHSWHIHGEHMTSVYYLDFPKDSSKTEWINPIDITVHQFDVEEGDIITFPSWIIHRAPENKSNDIKTIISWNSNVYLLDEERQNKTYV